MQQNPSEQQLRLPPFLSLPTEICSSILSYLQGDKDKLNFAKCSKECYYLVFNLRIRRVRVDQYQPKECFEVFDAGGWLAPVRRCIRSALVEASDITDITTLLLSLARFSGVTDLTISIENTAFFERGLYLVIFALLKNLLPFYGSITSLSLAFEGGSVAAGVEAWTGWDYLHTPSSSFGSLSAMRYRQSDHRLSKLPERVQTFLWNSRGYISDGEFERRLRLMGTDRGGLNFSEGVRSFGIHTKAQFWTPSFILFPARSRPGLLNTIHLRNIQTNTLLIPQSDGSGNGCFETIKSLYIDDLTAVKYLTCIPAAHFTHLEFLKIMILASPHLHRASSTYVAYIPHIPTLKVVCTSWAHHLYGYDEDFLSSVTRDLKCRLKQGLFGCLGKFIVQGSWLGRKGASQDGEVVCRILRTRRDGEGGGVEQCGSGTSWKLRFRWEGDIDDGVFEEPSTDDSEDDDEFREVEEEEGEDKQREDEEEGRMM
ncbi:hypothetical protein TWF481_011255 [Arthrobotrys musiformis]|uniref:F-box domain-containing protein n=1 Tax=Arthrobotrys musiformis TaxID=47236 RepID=A0AAV9VZ94_9PEZI